jgi:hypothetical protein
VSRSKRDLLLLGRASLKVQSDRVVEMSNVLTHPLFTFVIVPSFDRVCDFKMGIHVEVLGLDGVDRQIPDAQ